MEVLQPKSESQPSPNITSTTSSTTFTLFTHLPTEIRLKIWSFTLSSCTPRLINMHSDCTPIYQLPNGDCTYDVYFPPLTPPPAPISVCSESRFHALKTYKRCFEYHDANHLLKYMYVNFDRDVFVVDDFNLKHLPATENESVRYLIVRTEYERFHTWGGGDEYDGPEELMQMRALREITVVRDNVSWGYRGEEEREYGKGVGEYGELLEREFEIALGGGGRRDGWVCPRVRFVVEREEGWEELGREYLEEEEREEREAGSVIARVWKGFVEQLKGEEEGRRGGGNYMP